MSYLSVEEAQDVLIGTGVYSDAGIPSFEVELLIAQLQEGIDAWLGRSLEVRPYTEILKSNRQGIVRIEKKPIVGVASVKYYDPQVVAGPNYGPRNFISNWNAGTGILYTGLAWASFQVIYTAGYDPIPTAATTAMKMLLAKQAKSGADLLDTSSLYAAEKKVTSISLPGGLSKSIAEDGNKTNAGARDGTVLDKILTPLLSKYRVTAKYV